MKVPSETPMVAPEAGDTAKVPDVAQEIIEDDEFNKGAIKCGIFNYLAFASALWYFYAN